MITRSEGSRDILDIIRSFRARPHIVFYDNAGNLAAHIRKIMGSEFLGPLEGRLCQPNPTNIELLEEFSKRRRVLRELDRGRMYVLFDAFHFSGHRSMSDKCRTPFLLPRRVNTQAAEHINSVMKARVGYRTQMDWQLQFFDVLIATSDWNMRKNTEMLELQARNRHQNRMMSDPLIASASTRERSDEEEMSDEEHPSDDLSENDIIEQILSEQGVL